MKTEEMPKVSVWDVPESTKAGEKMQLFLHAEVPGLEPSRGDAVMCQSRSQRPKVLGHSEGSQPPDGAGGAPGAAGL